MLPLMCPVSIVSLVHFVYSSTDFLPYVTKLNFKGTICRCQMIIFFDSSPNKLLMMNVKLSGIVRYSQRHRFRREVSKMTFCIASGRLFDDTIDFLRSHYIFSSNSNRKITRGKSQHTACTQYSNDYEESAIIRKKSI